MRYRTELMEAILTSKEAQRIIDYITPIYGESYVGLWLLQSIGMILDEGESFPEEYKNQITPITATWSIEFWEKEYGVVPEPNWTLEQRRQNVLNTIRYKAPINPEKMEDLVTGAVGLPSEVTENTAKNTFDVTIIGYTKELYKAIETIDTAKPAHLIYNIKIHEILNSILALYYNIIASEKESMGIDLTGKDPYNRIADENCTILLDEEGSILIY